MYQPDHPTDERAGEHALPEERPPRELEEVCAELVSNGRCFGLEHAGSREHVRREHDGPTREPAPARSRSGS